MMVQALRGRVNGNLVELQRARCERWRPSRRRRERRWGRRREHSVVAVDGKGIAILHPERLQEDGKGAIAGEDGEAAAMVVGRADQPALGQTQASVMTLVVSKTAQATLRSSSVAEAETLEVIAQ